MSQLHPVPADFAARARIRADDYDKLYAESIEDPEARLAITVAHRI